MVIQHYDISPRTYDAIFYICCAVVFVVMYLVTVHGQDKARPEPGDPGYEDYMVKNHFYTYVVAKRSPLASYKYIDKDLQQEIEESTAAFGNRLAKCNEKVEKDRVIVMGSCVKQIDNFIRNVLKDDPDNNKYSIETLALDCTYVRFYPSHFGKCHLLQGHKDIPNVNEIILILAFNGCQILEYGAQLELL